MKIMWRSRDGIGRYGFSAESEAYDADPPIRELFVDRDMLGISDETLSLSGFLAFGNYCSGSVMLPRKVSPELAHSIQKFADPSWLQVSPVDFEPIKAPEGLGFAYVTDTLELQPKLPNRVGMPRNVTISVLDAGIWAGDLVATDRLIVASNVHTMAAYLPDSLRFMPLIAVGLLYLESFRCSTLVVPDDLIEDELVWYKTSSLLNAAKFGLLRESEALAMLEH